jgi:catechol 2,3-dioxygenase-like lactoylglutathione lyase family enzyme
MSEVGFRYIVDDVDIAITFYRDVLQFEVAMRPGPGFAML